ncbi:MAG: helix-turn-helix domain-containing protein, partial [Pyrinomonadaceae bacterium]
MNSKPSDQNPEEQAGAGGVTGSLGEQLRLTRERRGVSLREISDQTRISMRHLEAIEADDYKRLPGGIFNRSFIKAYARQINFNEEKALEAYARTAREHGDATDEPATSPRRSRVYMDGGDTSRSPLTTALLSGLILGILILGIYAVLHWYRRTDGAPADGAPAAVTGDN